jgi:hypothetical protein
MTCAAACCVSLQAALQHSAVAAACCSTATMLASAVPASDSRGQAPEAAEKHSEMGWLQPSLNLASVPEPLEPLACFPL